MDKELDELLAALRAPVESSGVFTLDVAKARHKLAQFQLQPGFYLLKLVQAAVSAGADLVRIANGDVLYVTFLGADPGAFPLQEVANGLTNPTALPADTPLAHLCTGLLAGLGCLPRELHWSAWRGKEGEALKIDGEGLSTRVLPKSPGRWHPRQVRFDLILVDCQDRDRRAERRAVVERCGFGPAKVRLNGAQVAPPWRMVEPFGMNASRLAEFYGARSGLGLYLPTTDAQVCLEPGLQATRGSSPLLLRFTDGAGPPGRALTLFDGGGGDSGQVVWVRYGVACEITEEALGVPATYAVVDASDLAVDASHFKMVRTPALEARLADVRFDARQLCRALLENLDSLTQPKAAGLSSGCATSAGCLGCLLGSLVGMPWIGLLTAVAGNAMGTGASTEEQKSWRVALKSRLEQALKEPWPPSSRPR